MHQGNLSVLLYVRNMTKSLQFYCDVLGGRLAWAWSIEKKRAVCEMSGSKPPPLAAVHFGGSEIQLRADPSHQPSEKPVSVVQLDVVDVDSFYRIAQRRGLKPGPPDPKHPSEPTNTPWGSRQVCIRDPDGHLLSFASQTGVRLH